VAGAERRADRIRQDAERAVLKLVVRFDHDGIRPWG
jgi:hypothetical protein